MSQLAPAQHEGGVRPHPLPAWVYWAIGIVCVGLGTWPYVFFLIMLLTGAK